MVADHQPHERQKTKPQNRPDHKSMVL